MNSPRMNLLINKGDFHTQANRKAMVRSDCRVMKFTQMYECRLQDARLDAECLSHSRLQLPMMGSGMDLEVAHTTGCMT